MAKRIIHGHSRKITGKTTPTYFSWKTMKQRCLNKKNTNYPRYGGRGITICERWLVFENFLADMGEKPPGTSLDRKESTGNYEPTNCRWATSEEQYANRKHPVEYKYTKSNKTGFRNVYLVKQTGHYQAIVRINGIHRSLGTKKTPEEAYALWLQFAERLVS